MELPFLLFSGTQTQVHRVKCILMVVGAGSTRWASHPLRARRGEKGLSKYLNSKVVENIPDKNKCPPLHMAQGAWQKIEWKDYKWLLLVRLAAK